MASVRFKQQIARLARSAPWAMASAQTLWRFTRPRWSAGVVGVVMDDQRRVLLAEHVYRTSLPWGLPGGWVDRGEMPDQTLARELREELELKVEIGPFLGLDNNIPGHYDFAYLCRPLNEVGTLCNELLSYGWFAADNLPPLRIFHRRAIQQGLEVFHTWQPA
jgi:ADP-ribose pyrophosphatase YjhB (NUDIX family)